MSVKYELLPGNVPRRGNLSLCISRRRLSTAILGVICLISLLAWIRPERPIIAIHPAEEPVQALNSSSSQADLVPSSSPSTAAVESTPVPDSPRPLLHFNDPKPCNRLSTTRVNGTVWMSPSPALPTYATLNDRLTAWLQSPLSSHANWTAFNNQTCGSSHVARAANQLHDRQNQATWQAMDAVEVAKLRYELVGMLRNASVDGKIPKRPTADPSERSSQGIVFTAGNADTMSRVVTSLRLLRSYGTTLPAEVFHFPSEEPSSGMISDLEKLGATVRAVTGIDKEATQDRTKSFHVKGAAMIQSSFDEILYLDSDSMPISRVEPLFDMPAYRNLGAMIWPDYWRDSPDNAIWSIIGVQCRDEWTQEAGQVLINRRVHMDALLLVEHMLKDWRRWFTFSDGDKDTLRYSFLALRKRWAVPGRHVSPASWTDTMMLGDTKKHRFCGHTMVQFDDRGRPMFVHANLLKRITGRDLDFKAGTTWGRHLQLVLPSDGGPESSVSSAFVLQADHLANVNAAGVGLLPAPEYVRQRAALEHGLSAEFFDGHKGASYVLCITTRRDVPSAGENSTAVAEQCALNPGARLGLRPSRTRIKLEPVEDEDEGRESPEEDDLERDTDPKEVEDENDTDSDAESDKLEIIQWDQNELLKGFEEDFYAHGGKASGHGFR